MIRRICVLFFILFISVFTLFAEEPPMQGLEFAGGDQTLNGKYFLPWQYADSFREQDGYAIVLGKKLHYWLYDTYTYHNGYGRDLLTSIIPQ